MHQLCLQQGAGLAVDCFDHKGKPDIWKRTFTDSRPLWECRERLQHRILQISAIWSMTAHESALEFIHISAEGDIYTIIHPSHTQRATTVSVSRGFQRRLHVTNPTVKSIFKTSGALCLLCGVRADVCHQCSLLIKSSITNNIPLWWQ